MIWTKGVKDRFDLIIIPKRIFEDFFNTHVFREFNKGEKTCLVTQKFNWTGIPGKAKVIQVLSKVLDREIITEGYDVPFPIPHSIFSDIKCKTFIYSQGKMVPYGDPFFGNFHITIKKIDGGWKKTLETLRDMTIIERTISSHEIRTVFENIPKEYNRIYVFVINHIHIERMR